MPTIDQTTPGTVSAVWGQALIRSADGKMRPLKIGDKVNRGDVILTTQDGIVQITPEDVAPKLGVKTPDPAAEGEVDRVITEVEQGGRGTAPGAGLTGGEGGSLGEGFRVERISEGLAPSPALRTATGEAAPTVDTASGAAPSDEEPRPTPEPGLGADSSAIGATEEGAPANLGLSPPTGALPGATVTVDTVPAIGEIRKADGSLVVAGSVLTPAELAGLVYVPPTDYNGSAPVGNFTYTVTSGGETASGGTTIALTAVNDAPVATGGSASGAEDAVLPITLGGSDVDGQVTGVTVTGIPAGGTLLLADGVTPVQIGETLTPAQAGSLLFRPAPDFNGNAAITFTVTDNGGAVSAPARVDLVFTAVNDAPVVTGESTTAVGTAPIAVDVLANDRDPDGDLLRVSAATVDPALGSVSINPDGTLRFSAAPGVTGTVTVTYTVTDPSGATATGTLSVVVAPGPTLTVDAPALTSDPTPTITGTTNLPAGSIVTLTITDALGAVQTLTATVVAGGTYSVDVPAALAEGTFTVVATASDAAGNSATANDSGALDISAPTLTVDAPALTNDSTPTITGTTNLPAGSIVTLTITDALGTVQTVTATVVAGGTYSVDVPAALAEGTFTVVATASDAAGNAATANDSGALDITAPSLTVDAPALTNDSTPTINGTTNLPPGSIVTLTITDALGAVQTVTATVVAGGTYSVDVPAALAEGTFIVVATASDAAGNAATANDAGALDITAPALTVDAPALTNDSTPTIIGTTSLPAGSIVTLTITDALGAVQTVTTTVVAGGTYSVDVPTALAEGTFTVVATGSDAAGNSATANDSGALDISAPTLTVDAPALTNDSTPTITGTTSLPAGSIVTLTITDALGAVQTVTATVVAGGTYSVDVPAALAEGTFTVVATASDAAGNAATANDSGSLDITAPSLTVDVPTLTSDSTPTITGTTNLPAGSIVTLTITDALGAVQTVMATVVAGGTYSVDVPAALAEGTFTVVATASDAAGNSATANDSGALDTTAPSLTVDAPTLTNDSTPTITGTTNLPAGSIVTLTITDALGAVQTVTATVVAGGTYSVDVPAALAEGTFTVAATATDSAGNTATANDSGALDVTAPMLTVDAPTLTNDSTPTITGTTTLPAGSIVTLTITDALGAVQTVTATVVAGGTYSVDVPAALAEGTFTVVATASDSAGNAATANDSGALDISAPTLTVDAPALTNDSTPTITGTTNLPVGSIVTLTITDALGAVQTVTANVVPGGTYSVDVPAALAEGTFTVVATASDAAGNSATANDSGALDISAPTLTVDAPALTNDSTPTITGTTNLPAGSIVTLTITDALGAVQTVTATVVAGGTYSVDVPAALAEGTFTVVATASDAAGNSATANDSGALDITAPSLTVDAPALTNDSTPTITGTTNLPAGSIVTLTITDALGAVQTVTATVIAGGTYSVDVPAALAEGTFTVVATASDPAGNSATANDSGALDISAPTLTVDAPALTNDSTPTIIGTTNLPAGSIVTLTITDALGAEQTVTATVGAGGTYSVDVPAALAEGTFTVVATASDAAGNAASANDSGALDITAPSLTVNAPALTNDSTPTITGTTTLPAGSIVTLTITDALGAVQTVTATVVAGGTYSVDVPAALAEGTFTVVATASDSAGNAATANDSGALDISAPTLTVDAPALTNDSTPTITGTTNLPAGSIVTLTITDALGAVQTVTANVVPGGTYSVDVPAALAEGTFTVVATASDAAGNAATANDSGALDTTAPSLTVDAPTLTNDSTPTITGTTNLPAGSIVTLTITDALGAVQTVTATVVAGGTYSVDVPAALAEGTFNVVATASDAVGNSATANDSGALDITAPALTVDAPALTNDSTPTITGTTNLPAGSIVTLTITDALGAVQTVTATVVAGGTYSVDVPAALAEGTFTVVATASDAAGNSTTANDSGALDVTAPMLTVDAPALTNDSTPTITGTTNLPAGSIVTLTITDAIGAVQAVTATVVAGGTYSVDVPAALAEGTFTVVATASDAAGNSATANDSGALDVTAPMLTVDAPALTNDSTPTITGTTNLPPGSIVTLTITDALGAVQTVTATVVAGGTYSVDVPAALAEGAFTVVATASDAAGNSASANDSGALDITAPSLTVDAPALTNDSTPTITGTTTLPAGSIVTLTITDALGAVQTVTATVVAGGTYSVDVPAALAEGTFTVVATASDSAGNAATANDSGALDITAPALTVDAPALTNDSTPTIAGTTNLPAGSIVTLTITDALGAVQTVTATVVAGGTYSVDVPAALAEGTFTVVATASDAAGNSATANDSGALDVTAPSLTVDAPALTNDSTPTIIGTTSLPAGSIVTLTITDALGAVQTVTATVVAGGTYSVDVPAALAEGTFTVGATASDAAGNSATANDSGALDITAPALTVDAPALTNDSTPTITGTTNLPVGSIVTLTITDALGAVQTVTATVVAGGTYSVDVPAALAEGTFTVVATASDAAGNAATANDSGALDISAPTLTVDAPALTNDSTPTITGTTNLPAGSIVTLTITDALGAVQTVTATVVAGGTYSVDVPAALAEGNFTVVATASDAAGNAASANDSGALDITAPSLTVDAPALTNDSTPTIAGTTTLPAGSIVTLTITDALGAVQTVTTTVVSGGTYSVDVPTALAEGTFTVVATASDAAGNAATANDAGALDITAPSLTVDAPALTNDSTPTITGTTNLPAGSIVTLTITDSLGAVQTGTATVVAGGTYSVDVPAALAEGTFTVVATASDAAGNAATANDAGALDVTAPMLTVDAPALTNDSTPTITGTTNLPAGSIVALTITDALGAVQTVSATVVAGGAYSVDVPAALAEGTFTVVATASDAAGNSATANDTGLLDITAPTLTVDAPALTNDSTPTITGTTNLPAGSIVTLTITDALGAVQTVTATVVAGGTYSVDVPAALAEGTFTVVATASDAAGNPATANDTGLLDITAPSLTVDAPALTNDSTPTITGTTNLPAGSIVTLTITDALGAVQTVTATVVAGGTYSVDVPAALAEGTFTVVATASDAAGNSATANDSGALDITAPSLTVDAPALTNDSTPTITGTTNLPVGSIVTMTITDALGAVQTVTATVVAGGTFSVDVPAALAEGTFTVVATASDAAGNSATANDTGLLDITAPTLTVDAPALTNDSTPTITGTTNLPAGSIVTLTITDALGAVQTVTATVIAGGTYSVDVPAALAEGTFTVVATASDAAGNSATANDSGALDITAPALTVDAPALTNDSTPTINGTTNLPPGSIVTLTITDALGAVQTVTATVVAGGTYSVDVPAALAEGTFTVVATASDAAGNSATANDSGALDITAPALTVDAPALTNDSTPTITGTTNLPPGSIVTLTITDALGAVQMVTATVVAGGTYSVDVPAALAEGTFTVVATASDAAGNAASANDSGALDITAPSLTVDAPTLTNDSTPTITGTTNLPAGSIVTLTITDAIGAVQTVTATVVAGGAYSVDVPAALAEGTFTVVATASDAAGNSATANDTGLLDITAPTLTVDAPALTNDSTPTITGTTNLPAGSIVTLTITDALGAVQTVTATVVAGGIYSVDVPAALAEGNFTVVATASDAAGNPATANDSGALDITAPSLTVDAPALTNDSTPTITGTTNLPAGSIVTLTITDALGAVQTVSATVVAGGAYSVDVPAALAEGTFDVAASASDAAGNPATANDTGLLDITAPSLTVDAPALTNDSTPTITGTTNLPAGSIVTLTITDALGAVQTVTATVVAGGTYTVDVPAALAEGTFTVAAAASDAAGNPATASDSGVLDITPPAITLTIDPVTADNILSVGEAAANVVLTGRAGGDAQAGDIVTLTIAGTDYLATVGAGGAFSVTVPGAALAADADRRIDASITTVDAAGNTASASASQAYAVNTAPAGTSSTITTAEDTPHDFSAADFGYSDADGNALAFVRIDTLPLAGELRLAGVAVTAGQVIAAADLANLSFVPAADANGAGYASFEFSVGDGLDFDPTRNQIRFDVTAVNDPAVIGGQASGAAVEDAPGVVGGTLTVADPDAGEAAFVAQSNVAGAHGRFSIDSTGAWTYTLDNADPAVQALRVGQTLPSETFTVTTIDGTSRQITVSITGTNDGPLAVADDAIAVEAGGVANGSAGTNPSGNVLANDTDVDAGDSRSVTAVSGTTAGSLGAPTAGVFGTLTLNADGSYGYVLDNSVAAVQALRTPADTLTDTFTYTMRDAAGDTSTATLTITIQGNNDTPVAFADIGSLNENDTLSTIAATGVLANDSDVDAGDTRSVSAVSFGGTAGTVGTALAGTYGTLTLRPDGSYDYSASRPATDALLSGQVVIEAFTYTVSDAAGASSTATLTFTITGTNDAPTISGPSAGTVKEDDTLTAGGTLVVTDADAGQSAFQAQSGVAGLYGSFSIASDGVWLYTLNNAAANVQALGGAASASENFTVTTVDGTTRTIVVTVNGTNDGPVAQADVVTIAEDAVAGGNVLGNDSDVDAGTTLTVTQFSVAGLAGTFGAGTTANIAGVGALTIAGNGTYSFVPLPDYAGPVPQATYTVSDGTVATTATLDITINPANDTPVNRVPAAVAVLEDVRTTIPGLSVADPDDAGSLANQKLATVQLSVSNGTLQVALAGGATISAGANGSATLTLSGSQAALNSTLASLAYQGNTNYVGGDALVMVSRDGLGLTDSDTVAITVNAVNDAPSGADRTVTVAEDGNTTLSRADFGFADAAGEGNNFLSVRVTPPSAGTLTLNGVAINAATTVTVAQLDAGQLRFAPAANANGTGYASLSFAVRDDGGTANGGIDTDPTPNTLTFDVTPGNDAPAAVADTGTVAENATLTVGAAAGVLANDTDIDAGDGKTVSAVAFGATGGTVGSALNGSYGTLTLNADGSYGYSANRPAVEALAPGQSVDEVFTYTVRDTAGLLSSTTLTITVTGANDAPVITSNGGGATAAVSVAENATAVTTVAATDVDAGQTRSYSIVGGADAARFTINPTTGALSFVAPPNFEAPGDADGNNVYVVQVQAADGNGGVDLQTLNVTVTNVNEAPVISSNGGGDSAAINVAENGTAVTTVAASDPEAGALTYSIAGGADAARFSINAATGALVFVAPPNFEAPTDADGNNVYQVVVRAADAAGNADTQTLNVTVTNVNEAPVNAVPAAQATLEDTTRVFSAANGNAITVSDVDAGAGALTIVLSASTGVLTLGSVAGVTVSGNGTGSVTLSGSASAINAALNGTAFAAPAHFSGNAQITVTTTDNGNSGAGSALADTDTIDVTVTAVADTPVVHAHLTDGGLIAGTSAFSANFNSGNLNAWTRTALTGNTFAEVPGGTGKTSTEAALFNAVAWGGQTTNQEFNNFWTLNNGTVTYNLAGGTGSDDAQGMLAYSGLAAADRALTSYVFSADLNADANSAQANGIGLVFGYVDANNYFLARWENPSADYAAGGSQFNGYPGQYQELSLVQIRNGTPIDLARAAFNGDDLFNLRIGVGANGITATAVDASSGATTTLNYAYGSVAGAATTAPALNTIGLYTFDNDSAVRWDNIGISRGQYRYTLHTDATLADPDGSETLSPITLSNLPIGVTLVDTVTGSAVTVTGGVATVVAGHDIQFTSGSALSSTQINAIQASVTATEASNGSTATDTDIVKIDVLGSAAGETLNGSGASDWLSGGGGADTLNAGGGDDHLFGGAGSDQLTGGAGADVFAWTLADRGAAGSPPTDTITDFNTAAVSAGGDVLDLRDLLTGAPVGSGNTVGSLTNYIDFAVSGSGPSLATTIHISSSGQFAGGTYVPAQEDQAIVLRGVDLPSSLGLGTGATDAQIIQELLNRGKLLVDNTP